MAFDRNLAAVNDKLLRGSEILQDAIRERLGRGGPVAVLEIGCGVGVALMELAWTFRHAGVSFAGINKKPGKPLASPADFRATARRIGLAPETDLDALRLPALFFEDATRMHFDDESFDVVYASSVLRFVPHKAEFLEEAARVLRPGGIGIIQAGGRGWDYPYGPASAAPALTPHPARWVLRHEHDLIPLEPYFALASGHGFTLEIINRPSCVIRMVKQRRGRLRLGLRRVPSLSRPMGELGYADSDGDRPKGGVRSVYDVGEAAYRELVDRGMLAGAVVKAGAGY